uniref:Transmembrane protein n=1 Tax=Acrobeloides nanus TaxID=290746 RepID=A0A914C3V2_9BILA
MILWIIFGLISSVPFVRGIECYFDSREAAPSLKNCSDEINFCYTFFVNPDYEDVGANGNDIPTNDCANRKYFNCAQDQFDSNYEVNYEGVKFVFPLFLILSILPIGYGIECYYSAKGDEPTLKNCNTTDFCITFIIDPDYNDGGIGQDIPTNDCSSIFFACAKNSFDTQYHAQYNGEIKISQQQMDMEEISQQQMNMEEMSQQQKGMKEMFQGYLYLYL